MCKAVKWRFAIAPAKHIKPENQNGQKNQKGPKRFRFDPFSVFRQPRQWRAIFDGGR